MAKHTELLFITVSLLGPRSNVVGISAGNKTSPRLLSRKETYHLQLLYLTWGCFETKHSETQTHEINSMNTERMAGSSLHMSQYFTY